MKVFLTINLILLVFIVTFCQSNPISSIIQTKYGLIEGTFDGLSREGRKFHQFRGIQYAVVQERFTSSVSPSPWPNSTIQPAKQFGKSCEDIQIHGDENCLFLNIFTEQIATEPEVSLRPVLVYIHGGSFQLAKGDYYGPNYIIDADLILVTVNYRLGLLGFLSTGDAQSPGNYGLKDQSMALKYIRENILNFGGDPQRITLMGQSAGGAAVTYHLMSPMSKGLFNNAVVASGTFLDPWAFTRNPLQYAKKMAEFLKCPDSNSTAAIVSCLKAVPAHIIASLQLTKNVTTTFFEDPMAAFGPTIEPLIGTGENTFLSESPYDLLVSGQIPNKVPLLSGVTMEEGIYVWSALLLMTARPDAILERHRLAQNWESIAPSAFYYSDRAPSSRLPLISQQIQTFYFPDLGFSPENQNFTFPRLSQLYSDRLFLSSAVRFLNLYSKIAPTYPYLYTFNKFVGLTFGMEDLHQQFNLEATHSSEQDMLFSPLVGKVRIDSDHDSTSKNILQLFRSFIATGIPSATYGKQTTFPPINASSPKGLSHWYRLDLDTELLPNIFKERLSFWESLQLDDNNFLN